MPGKRKAWTRVRDDEVQHRWACSWERCPHKDILVIVSPAFYARMGIPTCLKCGHVLEYNGTEVFK